MKRTRCALAKGRRPFLVCEGMEAALLAIPKNPKGPYIDQCFALDGRRTIQLVGYRVPRRGRQAQVLVMSFCPWCGVSLLPRVPDERKQATLKKTTRAASDG